MTMTKYFQCRTYPPSSEHKLYSHMLFKNTDASFRFRSHKYFTCSHSYTEQLQYVICYFNANSTVNSLSM